MPCLSTVMPWEAWYFGRGAKPGQPSPFKWTYHFGFGVEEFHKTYVSQWSLIPTNKKVGVLYPNDADGNAIRAHLAPALAKDGFTIVDAGPYEDGTTDYSAQIALFKKEKCEIFNTFPIPPDFAAFWRQAAQQGYTKMVKIVPGRQDRPVPRRRRGARQSRLQHLERRLLAQGVPLQVVAHRRQRRANSPTATRSAPASNGRSSSARRLSLFDAGFAALKAAGDPTDKAAVAKAIAGLNTTTIAGKVDFTSGPVPNVATGPIIGTQWVKAPAGSKFKLDFVVTDHVTDPNVPIAAKLLPYNS